MDNTFYFGISITVGIFLLTHLCVAIWFASSMKAKVIEITSAVKEMTQDLKELSLLNTRITVMEQRMARSEQDMREALRAAALLGTHRLGEEKSE